MSGVTSPTVQEAVEQFLESRRVANCSPATVRIYDANLGRFARAVGPAARLVDVDALAVSRYLISLGARMKAVSRDQHDRNLRTFFSWAVEIGLLASDPMRGIPRPRVPLPLPRVPTEDELRAVLGVCSDDTFEGVRNRALILMMADAGLRAGEVLRLRLRDWDGE